MDSVYLKTENLSVGYGGKPLISEINLHVSRGGICTLIGPNGGGKSTILKSIARQLNPLGGIVYIGGDALEKLSQKELARKVAVMMTERLRPELMTCREVAAMGRYPHTGTLGILSVEDNAKVDEAMRLVNITELAERDFSAISDGQRQRVMLARAICQEPELLVLDEPTSYLDVRYKLELLSILRSLAKDKNTAVLMSLHEIDLAQKVSDYIVCVKGDRIYDHGTPEEIFGFRRINELYDIASGSYDPATGSVELPPPSGKPDIFVISGGGSGTVLFRFLQRRGMPFYTGVLHIGDIDCGVAGAIAAETVSERPFRVISEAPYSRAAELIESCSKVICTCIEFAEINSRNAELLELAKKSDKKIYLSAKSFMEAMR